MKFPDLPFAVRFATYAFSRGDARRAIAAYYFVTSGDRETPVSDRAIARHCGVANHAVRRWRREWNRAFDAACEWERERGRDFARELAVAYGLDPEAPPANNALDAGGPETGPLCSTH